MPALTVNTIIDAKLGSTQLSAVYMGSTNIWKATPDPVVTLTSSRWLRNGAAGCTRGSRYEVWFTGIHNIDDAGRTMVTQYFNNTNWVGDENAWRPDICTLPNVPFDCNSTQYMCVNSVSSSPIVRMRFKLSDGTITDWAQWNP